MGLRSDIAGTTRDTFAIGNGVAGDKTLQAETNAATLPFLRYNDTSKRWEISVDGTALVRMGCAVVHWGNSLVSTTTTTRYLTPGYEAAIAPTTVVQWRVPFSGVIKNLRVQHNTPAGNGNVIVYTVRINGVASTLTVSLASTASNGSDTANSAVVAAGDLVDIAITKAAGVATSPGDVMASVDVSA